MGGSWPLLHNSGRPIMAGKKVRLAIPNVDKPDDYANRLSQAGDSIKARALPPSIEEVDSSTFLGMMDEVNARLLAQGRNPNFWCLGANYPGDKILSIGNASGIDVAASQKHAAIAHILALGAIYLVESGLVTINDFDKKIMSGDHMNLGVHGKDKLNRGNQAQNLVKLLTGLGIEGYSSSPDLTNVNHFPTTLMQDMIRFIASPNSAEYANERLIDMVTDELPGHQKKPMLHFLKNNHFDAHVANTLSEVDALTLGTTMEYADGKAGLVPVLLT
jgi:hypothetical protein